ncbi:hypothetical protein LSAT2_014057, partial [Lamellibrachia satsuma]
AVPAVESVTRSNRWSQCLALLSSAEGAGAGTDRSNDNWGAQLMTSCECCWRVEERIRHVRRLWIVSGDATAR